MDDNAILKIKEKTFQSPIEEAIYYKLKYTKYKGKYLTIVQANQDMLNNKTNLYNQIDKLTIDLQAEKLLRKSYQQKVNVFMKNEKSTFQPFAPIISSTSSHYKKKTSDFFNDDASENNDNNNKSIDHHSDNNRISGNINLEDNIITSTVQRQLDYSHDIFKQKDISQDSNMASSSLKEKTIREIASKFDTSIVSKSLRMDFLLYEKDSLAQRKKLKIKEEKIVKLEKVLKTWLNISDTLKKGFTSMTSALNNFNDNLINDQIDIFDECPDLISLIYILQSNLTDIISQFKFVSCSIENTFSNQISSFLSNTLEELHESKLTLQKHVDDFYSLSAKCLAMKKSTWKDSQKENYLTQYKLLEFTRYDYICKINSTLLYIKVELPEKIALFIYSFISLFRQGNELLLKTEPTINDNLEKITIKYKEKEKIIEEHKMNKKVLVDTFDKANLSVESKEGFLYIRIKDSKTYFKKRYIKFHKGNLIYFKIKKGTTDVIDTTKHYDLCNLLLCNVKKNDKDYEYPFCFEVVSANTKKNYVFQAEIQKEADEWIAAIGNAISNQISNYNDNSNEFEDIENEGTSSVHSMKESTTGKMITVSKCSDCNSENPTWLSINWLSMICIDCSSVHRSLGVNISKIKSLQLDNLDPDYLDLIQQIGPEKITSVLEANVKSYEKPKPNSMFTEKEIFITNKYKNRKYIKPPTIKVKEDIVKIIFQCIDTNDLITIYQNLIGETCDINQLYIYKDEKYSFMHHAAKIGKISPFRLLLVLGADFNLQDSKSLKPMDYATIYKNSDIADYIVRKMEEMK